MKPIEAFAARKGLTPRQARELRRLVNKAADAMTEEHNSGKNSDAETNAVDAFAKKHNLKVDWNPGLYPNFANKDQTDWEGLPD